MASRRELKRTLAHLPRHPAWYIALLPFAGDTALWVVGIVAVAAPTPIVAKVAGTLLLWLSSARLFVIGHDACHGSTSAYPTLNRVVARMAFLPTLTPSSLWALGHNVVHHGYNNLKGRDYVWTPLSPNEYLALPTWRRRLERFYRCGWGPWLYYLGELWWKKLFFPSGAHVGARRAEFQLDCWLVLLFALTWIGALVWVASATGQSPILLTGMGFVLPFLMWNWSMGFVVFIHHTHPSVQWFDDKTRWATAEAFVHGVVHVRMPFGIDWLFHSIFDHTAHHVDASISHHYLSEAQRVLERRFPADILVQDFSWRWYFETARGCQLYDYERGLWFTCRSVDEHQFADQTFQTGR